MDADGKPVLRAACGEDAEAVSALLDELEHPSPVDAVRRRLADMARMEHAHVIVAELDGEIVGMGTLQLQPVVHKAGPVGRITTMIVSDRYRGRGIGATIVDRIEALARQSGCQRMEVTSHNRRSRAHAFYEGLGYRDTARRFMKTL